MNNLNNIRIVLSNTSHSGNIGAAARAIKNMGLNNLYLVNPKDFPSGIATAMASGAQDILDNAIITSSLDEALIGCSLVIGASCRTSKVPMPLLNTKQMAIEINKTCDKENVAIVFGTERCGLLNEELLKCNYKLEIPANPNYPSLNLAQAVQVVCYEIYSSQKDFINEDNIKLRDFPYATNDSLELFYEHLEKLMLLTGFLNPDNPRQLKTRLRRLFNRARLDEMEVNILRGIIASCEKAITQN